MKQKQMLPLEWLLARLNDESIAATTRDRIAAIACPYVHPKLTEPRRISKKMKAEKAAKTAGAGSPWGDDLAYEIKTPQQ